MGTLDDRTSRRPRIGIALYADLTFDSRVRRVARSLALAGNDVVISCLADASDRADLPAAVEVQVRPLRDTRVVPGAVNPFRAVASSRVSALSHGVGWLLDYVTTLRSWGRATVAACGPVDAWHANDLTGLAAIAPFADRGTPIVYDVHDLMLDTGTALRLPRVLRPVLAAYERRLARRAAAVVTVNNGLADVIRTRLAACRVEIVHNCPNRWDPSGSKASPLRAALGIPADAPLILYHGGLSTDRGVEGLLQAVLDPALERAHLVLMGFGDHRDAYRTNAGEPAFAGRVHIVDAVAPAELLTWIAGADVGAVVHPGVRLNDRLKTPNKLFECLAAGVPVVASDFPLLRRIVLDDPAGALGALADPADPAVIAAQLAGILSASQHDRAALRRRCRIAADQRWNWETEADRLIQLYAELVRA